MDIAAHCTSVDVPSHLKASMASITPASYYLNYLKHLKPNGCF